MVAYPAERIWDQSYTFLMVRSLKPYIAVFCFPRYKHHQILRTLLEGVRCFFSGITQKICMMTAIPEKAYLLPASSLSLHCNLCTGCFTISVTFSIFSQPFICTRHLGEQLIQPVYGWPLRAKLIEEALGTREESHKQDCNAHLQRRG